MLNNNKTPRHNAEAMLQAGLAALLAFTEDATAAAADGPSHHELQTAVLSSINNAVIAQALVLGQIADALERLAPQGPSTPVMHSWSVTPDEIPEAPGHRTLSQATRITVVCPHPGCTEVAVKAVPGRDGEYTCRMGHLFHMTSSGPVEICQRLRFDLGLPWRDDVHPRDLSGVGADGPEGVRHRCAAEPEDVRSAEGFAGESSDD